MEIFGEKDMGQNRNIQSYFLKISHVYFAKSFVGGDCRSAV